MQSIIPNDAATDNTTTKEIANSDETVKKQGVVGAAADGTSRKSGSDSTPRANPVGASNDAHVTEKEKNDLQSSSKPNKNGNEGEKEGVSAVSEASSISASRQSSSTSASTSASTTHQHHHHGDERPFKRHKSINSSDSDADENENDEGGNADSAMASDEAQSEHDEEDSEEEGQGQNLDSELLNLEVEDTDDEDELLRRILSAAAARGISLDFLAAQAHHGYQDDDDFEPVEYKFDSPPQSLADVAEYMKSPKCQKIVILAGAGMSVASGIPDFRSANGLYATLQPDTLTCDEETRERIRNDPCYCLDQHLFMENPLPCLEVNREFILGVKERKWKATLAHRFIELINTQLPDKLCRLYTQNIDGLEDQTHGLDRSQRIAVHGSMDKAECAVCNAEMDFDHFCNLVRTNIRDIRSDPSERDPTAPDESTPIQCESCGANSVKPSIVLFRSSLPREFFQKMPPDTADVDLLIVMGTSLHVAPANSIVWRVPRNSMRLLINREPVGYHLGMNVEHNDRDFFGEGNCENVCLKLMRHLGWLDKLKVLLEKNKLPESSAKLLQEELSKPDDDSKSESEEEPTMKDTEDGTMESEKETSEQTPRESEKAGLV